jgi:hypothetical protein
MNTFGIYFNTAGSKLATSVKVIPESHDLDDFVPSGKLFSFYVITHQNVKKTTLKLKTSSTTDNFGFSSRIVNQVASNISSLLAYIFNYS